MLPKLKTPLFDVNIPSLNKKVKARPMTVKEEKLLLMAKQSGERLDQLKAILQVINNCLQAKDVVVEELCFYDLEYLFLKIREQSISGKSKVAYRDNEDEKIYNFDIDFEDIEIKKPEKEVKNIVELEDDISMVLKYPAASLYISEEFFKLEETEIFEYILLNSIDKICQGETIYNRKTMDIKELKEFIETIPSKKYEEIQEFFDNVPSLYYKIEYTNEKGTKREIELKSIDDFFTFA